MKYNGYEIKTNYGYVDIYDGEVFVGTADTVEEAKQMIDDGEVDDEED